MKVKLIGTLLLIMLTPFAEFSGSATRKWTEKRTSYGIGVETGVNFAKYHDTCIMLRALFVSDDFFPRLKKIETPAGKQFMKGKEIYRTFPENIVVDVEADALPCDFGDMRLPPPDIATGLLGSLSFKANWQKQSPDDELRIIVPAKIEHQGHGIQWDYFLEIPSKDIPLTANLVVDVTGRENIHLATFSAHL